MRSSIVLPLLKSKACPRNKSSAGYGRKFPSAPPSRMGQKTFGYLFGIFGSVLLIGRLIVFVCWKAFNAWQDWPSSSVITSIMTMLSDHCLLVRDGIKVKSWHQRLFLEKESKDDCEIVLLPPFPYLLFFPALPRHIHTCLMPLDQSEEIVNQIRTHFFPGHLVSKTV